MSSPYDLIKGVFIIMQKEIIELEKYYEIHESGYLTRKKNNSVVGFSLNHKGYLKARLQAPLLSNHKDRRKPFTLHRIIAMKYILNPFNKPQVNHKDGIKTNNHVENLEWCNNSENVYHAWNMLDSIERRRLCGERNYKRVAKLKLE